jgi:hypothetical protein
VQRIGARADNVHQILSPRRSARILVGWPLSTVEILSLGYFFEAFENPVVVIAASRTTSTALDFGGAHSLVPLRLPICPAETTQLMSPLRWRRIATRATGRP